MPAYRRPNLGRYSALMPLWVFLLMVFTGSVPRESSGYRVVVSLGIFLLGWGVGLGRAALATNRGESRGTPIAGIILNLIFFVLFAMSVVSLPAPKAPAPISPVDTTQSGRASDR